MIHPTPPTQDTGPPPPRRRRRSARPGLLTAAAAHTPLRAARSAHGRRGHRAGPAHLRCRDRHARPVTRGRHRLRSCCAGDRRPLRRGQLCDAAEHHFRSPDLRCARGQLHGPQPGPAVGHQPGTPAGFSLVRVVLFGNRTVPAVRVRAFLPPGARHDAAHPRTARGQAPGSNASGREPTRTPGGYSASGHPTSTPRGQASGGYPASGHPTSTARGQASGGNAARNHGRVHPPR